MEFLGEDIPLALAFVLLALLLYSSSIISMRLAGQNVPVVGLRSIFEHRLSANYNFFKNAAAVINDGNSKVNIPRLTRKFPPKPQVLTLLFSKNTVQGHSMDIPKSRRQPPGASHAIRRRAAQPALVRR
jgi:hypothetical protein